MAAISAKRSRTYDVYKSCRWFNISYFQVWGLFFVSLFAFANATNASLRTCGHALVEGESDEEAEGAADCAQRAAKVVDDIGLLHKYVGAHDPQEDVAWNKRLYIIYNWLRLSKVPSPMTSPQLTATLKKVLVG